MTYLDVAKEDPHYFVDAISAARSMNTGQIHCDLMLRFVGKHWAFLVANGDPYLYKSI